ncbi:MULTISPECIES: PepSY-associated TM helix domain-containing protein [Rhodopseudomonas]|uniref:PepSY-associated TM helix domain-containing protein n=1 Tax=Rhodopseudomonas sp. BAL398 TaxID=3034676 RepID=UPI0023E0FF53|nr:MULTISPECIES: PepSY-associated TM helix domain-containing protein [Rhodopseudomonas]MDF3809427.1 PepSY-associated TM helix domain-containing protein [Rhodopseudomonas sp. BAL398]
MVHTWTSLVSTLFLLLLCITGLPLIFHHEIDEALGYAPVHQAPPPGAKKLGMEAIGRVALQAHPGQVIQYIGTSNEDPGIVNVFTNHAVNGAPDDAVVTTFDAYTGQSLGRAGTGPMLVLLKLHTDVYLGQPGKLFMGAMGFVFLIAIVSGVVLYWPFTRRLSFATIRDGKSRRIVWLDWHNLLGIVTLVWGLMVGGTGVINTLAEPMLQQWKSTELAAMVAASGGAPPQHLASLDLVLANAMRAAPGMELRFIAFPGTPFTSSHHFGVYMRGDDALTARLLKPVLLDGETGAVTSVIDLPLYLKALLVSQPLHFGDYGGMPLKIIWALLDGVTIIVLGSGLYLWLAKRRKRSGAPQPASLVPSR